MSLRKFFGGTVLSFVMLLLTVQVAGACIADPIDPYKGLWELQDDAIFSYAIYTPVENGIMTISSVSGELLYSLSIDEKTYPDFQELQIPEIIDIDFIVSSKPVEYYFYNGSSYTGLKLLADDKMSSFGLVKIKGVKPAPVPVPGAVWLLGAGLIGLAAIKRK